MNISHAKTKIVLIAALAAAAALAGGVTSLKASAAEAPQKDASLFLPSSYEQYLEMNKPKDIAIDKDHIAIADGNRIFLCDRNKQEWRTYTNGADHATFGKIQLANGILYFTDAAMKLHSLDPNTEELTAKDLSYSLSNFIVVENVLYGTTTMNSTTSLYKLSLEGTTSIPDTKPIVDNLPAQLPLTYSEETIYYAVNNSIFPIDTKTHETDICISLSTNNVINPRSIAVIDGYLYYTEATGFYRTNIENTEEAHIPEVIYSGEDFSALTVLDGKIYILQNTCVREFDPAENTFTGYEIASASSSVNRLSGAVDTARAGDLLVTADAAGSRVSVYNFATEKYSEITGIEGFTPTHVATSLTV